MGTCLKYDFCDESLFVVRGKILFFQNKGFIALNTDFFSFRFGLSLKVSHLVLKI